MEFHELVTLMAQPLEKYLVMLSVILVRCGENNKYEQINQPNSFVSQASLHFYCRGRLQWASFQLLIAPENLWRISSMTLFSEHQFVAHVKTWSLAKKNTRRIHRTKSNRIKFLCSIGLQSKAKLLGFDWAK